MWPQNYPDLNTLDYFSGATLCKKSLGPNHLTIDALKAIVEEFIISNDPYMIRKSCSSARKRFEMVIFDKGGRLQHKKNLLKSKKKI